MPPLMLDRSLAAHAFCFCPFVVATTIPRHCIPWLAVRIALVAEAVVGFLLSVLAVLLVYWFPALAQRKPPTAIVEPIHAKPAKRRPKLIPIQTVVAAPKTASPLAESAPGRDALPVRPPLATPAIVLTAERSPVTNVTTPLPTVIERVVLHTPPVSQPPSPHCLSPAPSVHCKDSESTHATSVASESSVKRCRKATLEALSRGRPVSMPPMERAQTMCGVKGVKEPSPSPPRRHQTISMRSMRASLLPEPIRLLSMSPRASEKDCILGREIAGKEKRKSRETGKSREKEKNVKSKRATARTDPYAAPFFFPSPASPDAGQYTATFRERPTPTPSPIASPLIAPALTPLSSASPPAAPIVGGSLKGKRRLFGSHKRHKSDVTS
ncbi:unnamed protein product [Peniophora sp. CBMAI 1063]|nr:unnamed protein product [Peniophora sp. CBMAI 1063]